MCVCVCTAPLTGVPGLAVDALLGGAAHCPVPVHEEAVAQGVEQPLHSRGHTAAGRQAGLPRAAQEHTLGHTHTVNARSKHTPHTLDTLTGRGVSSYARQRVQQCKGSDVWSYSDTWREIRERDKGAR